MHTFPSGIFKPGRFGSFLAAASLVLTLIVVTGCNTRPTTNGLQGVEVPTPEAEPCGGDCPEGTICVPVIDETGAPAFACLDVHLRYCSPCLEDSDCIDPFMPDAGSLCVTREDGSGSYCATDCTEHSDCPEGAYCLAREDGRAVCMPENLNCECSDWATENEMVTQCTSSNINGTCMGQRICDEDGLSECDAPIAQEEICNDADDNCDGIIDESFPTQGEVCDGGDADQCSDGALTCDRGLIICLEDPAGRSEVCNGLDDDCDAVADNNLVDESADNQEGICAGSLKVCAGEAGWAEPDYSLVESFELDELTCDSLDNDCDGDVDERFGAEGDIAFTDVDASIRYLGDTCGVGVCDGGLVVCGEDGESLACDSVAGAQAETCDGLDNDCDGEVDEGFEAPFADLQEGVCTGMIKVCVGVGGWAEPDYTALTDFEVEEISCDGLDNDCDGQIDELHSVGGSITYTDVDGTAGLGLGQTCGVGACGGGVVECGSDSLSLTCSSLGLAGNESCNGADDDCNGAIDDLLTAPAAALQAGACSGALKVCGAAAGWLEPAYTELAGYEAQEASCDGIDNDCNGFTDDGLDAPAANNQDGVCLGSTQICNGSLGWQEPNYTSVAGYEQVEMTCDGLDNNCNGTADDGLMAPMASNQQGVCGGAMKVCGGSGGWVEPDYSDVEFFEANETLCDGRDNDCDGFADNTLVAPAANLNTGVCSDAVKTCGGVAGWQEPSYALIAGFELDEVSCDGLDNDCDGFDDENLSTLLSNLQHGVCEGMTKICDGSGGWQEPDYGTLPTFQLNETYCDGLDNDCDGEMDEDLVAPLAAYQEGVCLGATLSCAGVSGWTEPDYSLLTGHEASETACDGLDNDCDGNIDEQLVAPESELTSGVCAGSVKVCAASQGWVEPDYAQIEGYVVEESQQCDDLDNDCDGDVDETFSENGVLKFVEADGVTELYKGQECGTGSCSGGQVVCAEDAESLSCSTLSLATLEVCDGRDNDCNTVVDDIQNQPTANIQFGVCQGSLKVCAGVSGWDEPDYESITGFESDEVSCDGLDNNCDGLADNGLSAPLALKQAGVCAGAVKTCDGNGGWLEPGYTNLAGFEASEITCDDLDNDCDGETDELYLTGGLFTYTDLDGTSGLIKGDVCGDGVCAGGSVACAASGVALTCTTEGQAASDICDGLDNDCDGSADEDFDLNLDLNNCGSCGNVCDFSGGVGTCSAGICDMAGCDSGFGDCNGDMADGCEQNLLTDMNHCGGCNQVCNPPNATGSCQDGDCTIIACDAGYADCNGLVSDGCEVTVNSDVANCGSCSNACFVNNGGAACNSGSCEVASCNTNYSDCNGVYSDGCEISLASDVLNCGGCNLSCANDHGSALCSGGSCVPVCDPLWGNCDGNGVNGCEQQLDVLNHCSACGVVCDLANASESCAGGSCAVASCFSGYADCNGAAVDGCEAALATDVSNCGACGSDCYNDHGTTACSAGNCAPTCDSGWSDCDGDPSNGCETNINTLNNCGSCGSSCELANGSESCAAGTCELTGCNTGYADCDAQDANGCEIYTLNDVSNCGSCGLTCNNDNGGAFCSAGQCAPSCNSGWGDCDDYTVNGCETQLGTLSNCSSCGNACNLPNASSVCSSYACAVSTCSEGYCDSNGVAVDGCEYALDSNPSCSQYVDLDQYLSGLISPGNTSLIRGDYADSLTFSGLAGEYWFRMNIVEGYSNWALSWDLSATITVDPGSAVDYDLEVYYDNPCSGQLAGFSSSSGGTAETVNISWNDNVSTLSFSDPDDSRYIFIRVKFQSGNSCSSGEASTYTLTVVGDT